MPNLGESAGHLYDQIVRRRIITLVTHLILGLLVGFIVMSRQDFSHFHWWRRAGFLMLTRHLLGSWPYVMAGIYSHVRAWMRWLEWVAYILILLGSTLAVSSIYLGIVIVNEPVNLFMISSLQMLALVVSVEFLSRPEA